MVIMGVIVLLISVKRDNHYMRKDSNLCTEGAPQAQHKRTHLTSLNFTLILFTNKCQRGQMILHCFYSVFANVVDKGKAGYWLMNWLHKELLFSKEICILKYKWNSGKTYNTTKTYCCHQP